MVASVGDIHSFRRARQFAAWLVLTPREYSSGQTRHVGGISKRGDSYLRLLLTHGARSALLLAHRQANGLCPCRLTVELSGPPDRQQICVCKFDDWRVGRLHAFVRPSGFIH